MPLCQHVDKIKVPQNSISDSTLIIPIPQGSYSDSLGEMVIKNLTKDQFCLAFTNFTGREHQGAAGLPPVRIQFYICHEAKTFEFGPIQLSCLGISCCELRVRQLLLGLPAELGLPADGDPAAPDRHAGPLLPLPPDDAWLPCVGRNLLHLHRSHTGK